MKKILVLNGPNLNMLGAREVDIYGSTTLAQLHQGLITTGLKLGLSVSCLQSNAEHELIDAIHRAKNEKIDMILINPAGYTHTSIALRDALLAVCIPFFEIHLSNIYARETFRHVSYFSDIAKGSVIGFGPYGYELALNAAHHYLQSIERGNQ
jgi:3-dehydroquinate dehydratase-2